MPAKLTATIYKIQFVPNRTNLTVIHEFFQHMENSESSVHHKNNNLKVVIAFAYFLGPTVTFYEIRKKTSSDIFKYQNKRS